MPYIIKMVDSDQQLQRCQKEAKDSGLEFRSPPPHYLMKKGGFDNWWGTKEEAIRDLATYLKDIQHLCITKTFTLVEVQFTDASKIPLKDLASDETKQELSRLCWDKIKL